MNYKRSKDELSHITESIFKYNFKEECLQIYDGAHTKTNLKYAEWEERCRKLLDTFFSRDGESCGIILFPDVETTLHSQISQVKMWPRVLKTLNDWCEISSPKDATGLIIRNYDLKDHLYFRGILDDEIKDTLGFNNSKNMFSFMENDKRFLAFNPSLKIILIIRLVDLRNGELQLVKKEVDHCIDEVNILCFLLRDELADTGVILTGFVAYSGENAHSQSGCDNCDNMIFSFEIFNSVETFKSFWRSFFCKEKNKGLIMGVARNIKKDKANVFQAVASKMLGYLSHLQFATLQEPVLPITEQDPIDNIKQAELLLNCYQMEIAYSDDKRIWLEGNYGTGKTVVAIKKLELLLKALKDEEVVYYVTFAESVLCLMIKQRFKKNENFRAIFSNTNLSRTIKDQILPEERKLGTKSIHLIVDEYSSEYLYNVESLIAILNEEEELINSTVLIAVQPIKINRVKNICENGITRQLFKAKPNLDKLIKAAGMKVRTLKKVMRTTVQINKLAEFTREYLDGHLNHSKSSYKKNLRQRLRCVAKGVSRNCAIRTPLSKRDRIGDYDAHYDFVHNENLIDKKNYSENITSYSYTCDSQIGHGIIGPFPQLIKLPKLADLSKQVALIAAVFYEVIAERKPIRIAVIHFGPNDPPFWLKSLLQLKNISKCLTLTTSASEFLRDESTNLVLVKKMKFLRGLEFSKVLLILESNQHLLRHLIPEAITRCMKDLIILIRPPVYGNHASVAVEDLVDEWEKNLDNGILRMHDIGFCTKPSCNSRNVQLQAYCKDRIPFGTCYRFHQNSKLYADFLKEIQLKTEPEAV